MKWAYPQILVLTVLLVFLSMAFFVWAYRRKRKLLELFCDPTLWKTVSSGVSRGRFWFRVSVFIAAIFFAGVALSRPQFGFQWEEVQRKGVDLLVAIDVSSSMLAQDVDPNRLERARREVIDLLRLMQGDRIGIIAFAGMPYLQCPLTLDYGAAEVFLSYLNSDLIPVPGTALADVIRLATQTFSKQTTASKALILITDGEDHAGDPVEAAREAGKAGIVIYTIGIGKVGGSPIPNRKGGGFRKNRSGELILTKMDEETLKKVAAETGGLYVRSVTGDLDLEKIYLGRIRQEMEQTEFETSRRKRWKERFQWPLALSVLLLMVEPFISERKRRRP